MTKETPEDIQLLLKKVIDAFDKEDPQVRERQIREYKKLKLYWNGFQRLWWSNVAHDWKVWDESSGQDNSDAAYYDKPINIFRAYLESIIAALSINIPSVRCLPDDANNPSDVSTAKAGNKIYELVSKHNDSSLLWLQALYIFCTEGLTHAYSYTKEDESYGSYDTPEYKEESVDVFVCPSCGNQLDDSVFAPPQDEFQPNDESADVQNQINQTGPICSSCSAILDPSLSKTPITVNRLVGVTTHPKSRQIIEVYGGLFVKTPTYARKQADMPYLCYSYETHYSAVVSRYKHLKDKVNIKSQSSGYDSYERWGRLSTQYNGSFPEDMVTIRNWWLRPFSFDVLDDVESDRLKKLYPSGVKVVLINTEFAESCNENLDDCWTLSRNPLSDYIQFDPLGLALVSVQDIINDLDSLTLQTIEQGIPQTFADPAVLDFDAYRNSEAAPGSVYATKGSAPGKSIGDSFTTLKTATLGQEVLPFGQYIQSMGQVASGALPSLFGGEQKSGSNTASEYSMSRAQALQRLQNTWKIFSIFWKDIFGKVIPAYIKEVVEDERFVKSDKDGNYINVYIRKAELEGKIGDVELESSEQLPVTWAQKRDVIKELLTLQVPGLMESLLSPENIPLVKEAFGLTDFVVPGEADRQKSYETISDLLESEPIEVPPDPMALAAMQNGVPVDPSMMQPQQMPSIEVDPELDNLEITADIFRNWLISEVGRQAKVDNPSGYFNVLLYFKQVKMFLTQQLMAQQAAALAQSSQSGPGGSNNKDKNPSGKEPTSEIAAQSGDGDGSRQLR